MKNKYIFYFYFGDILKPENIIKISCFSLSLIKILIALVITLTQLSFHFLRFAYPKEPLNGIFSASGRLKINLYAISLWIAIFYRSAIKFYTSGCTWSI